MNSQQSVCDAELLARYLDQQLQSTQAAQVEQHLDYCQVCRQQLEKLAASPDFWNGIQSRLRHQPLPSGLDSPNDTSNDNEFGSSLQQSISTPRRADLSTRIATTQNPADGDDESAKERLSSANAVQKYLVGWLAPTDDPDSIGRLAGYEIVGVVGIGGMSVVLKGFDRSLNRYVAIKVLGTHLAGSGAARKRFAREAQAAAAIVHENVLAIHTIEEFNDIPYLVMPYVRGESLEKRSQRVGPLQVIEVLRIGQQIAAGLSAAHDQGLVHRDIKPANILLDEGSERLKISDFGLARAAADASLTHSGSITGTPLYMSPEQSRGEPVDHRSDIFSFGCLLYTLCTGHPPFRAETPYGIIRRICDDEARPIRESNPEVPSWLEGIIQRMMAKQVADRFATANELDGLFKQGLTFLQKPPVDGVLPATLQRCSEWSGPAKPNPTPSAAKPLVIATLVTASAAIVLAIAVIGLLRLGQGNSSLVKNANSVAVSDRFAASPSSNDALSNAAPNTKSPGPAIENKPTKMPLKALPKSKAAYQFTEDDEVFYRVELKVKQPDYLFKLDGLLQLDVKAVENGEGELGYRFSYQHSVHPVEGMELSGSHKLLAANRECQALNEMETAGRIRIAANGGVVGRSARCQLPGEMGLLNDWIFPAMKLDRNSVAESKQVWSSECEFAAELYQAPTDFQTLPDSFAHSAFPTRPIHGGFSNGIASRIPSHRRNRIESIHQSPAPIYIPIVPDVASLLGQSPEICSVQFNRTVNFSLESTKKNAAKTPLLQIDMLGEDQAESHLSAEIPSRAIRGHFVFDSEHGSLESLNLDRGATDPVHDFRFSEFDHPASNLTIHRVTKADAESYMLRLRELQKAR